LIKTWIKFVNIIGELKLSFCLRWAFAFIFGSFDLTSVFALDAVTFLWAAFWLALEKLRGQGWWIIANTELFSALDHTAGVSFFRFNAFWLLSQFFMLLGIWWATAKI